MSRYYLLNRLASRIAKRPASKMYLNYLQSPQWRQIRLAHIEHADGLCEVCRWRKATQVHHWTYLRLGREQPEDLCAVCTYCHHDLHCLVPDAANDNEIQLTLDYDKDDSEAA